MRGTDTMDEDEAQDRALLDAWRKGDKAAGSKLFDRHYPALLRFFRNKVERGVEDLIQETMLACVQGRDRLRDDGTFRAYLFGAARFVLYGFVRRKRGGDLDADEVSLAAIGPGIATNFAKHAEQQLILHGLRRLPMTDQMTLELYYFEGLSAPEIASALELPLGTDAGRIRRGTARLREEVERLAESPDLMTSTITHMGGWLEKLGNGRALPSLDESA